MPYGLSLPSPNISDEKYCLIYLNDEAVPTYSIYKSVPENFDLEAGGA